MKIRGQVCKEPPSRAIYGFQDGEGTEDLGDRPLERQTDKRAAFSVSRRNHDYCNISIILRTSIDKVP
ncbi:hypothetical protein ALC53_09930 [Atta colombica]|uniref:Uncharacterized protein n=1 Tax=Atta colombica TaxID=520822 RepID=A0A195B5T5_9HYME|nr:hypothetical protein ALC53_09930 [Atta colombica]